MNNNQEEKINNMIRYLETLDSKTIIRLKEILLANQEQYKIDPIDTLKKALITIMSENQLTASEDQAPVKTIHDDQARGKAFVEAMSAQAEMHMENIQARREQRYEEMIAEAEEKYGPITSPMDRLNR